MSVLAADRAEISGFLSAIFRHADGYISHRTFEHEPGRPAVEIRAEEINGTELKPSIALAIGMANRAAQHPRPVVFAPITSCTFTNPKHAAEADIRNGVALVVELDERPGTARTRLEGMLGLATAVVLSGGEWVDPATGEVQPKLHLYWRLAEPTRAAAEHACLKRARAIATAIVGGDASAVPLPHPLRCPGSWHRKSEPRLCRCAELRPEIEVDLDDAVERLDQAAALALQHAVGKDRDRLLAALDMRAIGSRRSAPEHDPDDRDPDLDMLADIIPNDDAPWPDYIAIGLAFYAATDGGAAGFNAWDRWAQKSAAKYDDGSARQWAHFAGSPPDRTGKGALVKRARLTAPDLRLPSWGPERTEPLEEPELANEPDPTPQGQPWPAPLAPEAHHGIVGDIVRAIEPETEADPAALLFQILTAAGNILGPGAFARVEADRHPPRLFVIQVGRTAKGRKGTSWGRVRSVLETVAPEWASERLASGLSSGEGVIYEVRDPVMGQEKDKRTGEISTVVVDPGVTDKRLLLFEGEIAKALRVMERQGSTLSAVLRDAWDHGNLRTLIKNNPNRATGAHISLIGHITDDELRRYLDRTEMANGLANRLIFVCVQRSKLLPRGGRMIDWSSIEHRLRAILIGAPLGEIGRTDAAWGVWEAVYPTLSADRPGMLGAILGRAEAQVLRLALTYALLDRSSVIDEPHILAALACWDYAEASARFDFGDALGDPIADEILRALRERPEGLTRTDLMHHFGRHLSGDQIGRALAVLAKGNFAQSSTERTSGRPAERWRATR